MIRGHPSVDAALKGTKVEPEFDDVETTCVESDDSIVVANERRYTRLKFVVDDLEASAAAGDITRVDRDGFEFSATTDEKD
jgi:hypothetical protein